MTISAIEMRVAFSKLFKDTEAKKADVLQFGVSIDDFEAIDIDDNEYLGIDEALKNNSVSELLYSNMVSGYGVRAADEAEKESEAAESTGGNPFMNFNFKGSKGNPFSNKL